MADKITLFYLTILVAFVAAMKYDQNTYFFNVTNLLTKKYCNFQFK